MKALKTAWHNTRRSPYQALAAILIITQTFFVVSIFALLIIGSSKIISYFESAPQVTAFFKADATQNDITGLQNQIEHTGKVDKINFVSKQEAFSRYKTYNKNDPLLLDLVSADILPPSLEVSTFQAGDLFGIASLMQKSPSVDRVVFQSDVVSRLESWTNFLRKFGVALVIVLALDSIFIMLIIISIKISQKREDIEIMRLIGASTWYIRRPFLLEGVIYGVVGAIIGWIISTAVILYAQPFLATVLSGIPLLPISPVFLFELLGLELFFAIILGVFSSYLAVLRYLK